MILTLPELAPLVYHDVGAGEDGDKVLAVDADGADVEHGPAHRHLLHHAVRPDLLKRRRRIAVAG